MPYLERAATNRHLTCAEVEQHLAHIQLTEYERACGLIEAYKLAAARMEEESKQRQNEMLNEAAKNMCTYNEQREQALAIGKQFGAERNFNFEIDEHNEEVLHLLCLYFTNDPEFENYSFAGMPYSLSKGIWLQSAVRGTGKTILLRLFARNKRNCFHSQHVPELLLFARRDPKIAMYELEQRTMLQPMPVQRLNFLQTHRGFMYDEMFGEEKANIMGNQVDISEFIIQRLYDQRKEENWFWKFHITSNYSGEEIEAKCGATVRSRMGEMFNLIKMEGPDRRRKSSI